MICGHCKLFGEFGRCYSGVAGRQQEVGYFREACKRFEAERPLVQHEEPALAASLPRTKVCKLCGRELPIEDFARNRYGPMRVCKECRSAQMKTAVAIRTKKRKKR